MSSTMPAGKFSALVSAFSNRNYAIYISGNCLSLIGFWMQRIAVSWLAWEVSHSEFWVGAVAFAELFPSLLSDHCSAYGPTASTARPWPLRCKPQ